MTSKIKADITSIDQSIKKAFQAERNLKEQYEKRIQELVDLIPQSTTPERLTQELQTLQQKLAKIHDMVQFKMYVVETSELIEKYKKILEKPVVRSFMGTPKQECKEKTEIIKKYLKIAKKYRSHWDAHPVTLTQEVIDKTCFNKECPLFNKSSDNNFIHSNGLLVCKSCSSIQPETKNTSSYADVERINLSSRYLYDRKVHFRDCILQYQGKQNVTVEPKVYEELIDQFEKHHLLIGDAGTPGHIRFANITKTHISLFLKELRYSKHYENVQLIHYNITGRAPPCVSHLEEKILLDFEKLTSLYDQIYKSDKRKNFINTQYVLFQLLRRHKHPCEASEFAILKTSERRDWHHQVCKKLFGVLNWNFQTV
jgi:hypothetical protein